MVIGEVTSSKLKPKFKKLAEFIETTHTVASIYRPEITYTYEIDGEKYTNNIVRPVGRNVYKQAPLVQRVLNMFPEGSNVYVFYNPVNHHKSVLDPFIRFSPVVVTIPIALIFLGVGLSFSGLTFLIPLGINFISFALYIASLLIIGQNFRYLGKVLQSKKWLLVEGKIKKVMVYRHRRANSNSYNVDVTYIYNVEGRDYTSHQRKIDFVHGARTFVPKIFAMLKAEKYEEGNKINVFYNPQNHNESILEHGLRHFTFWLMMIVGIGLFLFGLLVIQFMIYDIVVG